MLKKIVNGIEVDCTPEEEAEIRADWEKNSIPMDYKAQRALEYPDIKEYIDGVVKGDQAQIQAYIDACQAVKLKYPKV